MKLRKEEGCDAAKANELEVQTACLVLICGKAVKCVDFIL